MVAPAGAIGKGVAAIGDAGAALPIVGRALGSRLAQTSATGSAVGAADAAGNDQNVTQGAIFGAGAGAGGELVARGLGAAAGKAAGLFSKTAAPPSTAELATQASNAYKAFENADAVVNPQAGADLATAIKQTMADANYDPSRCCPNLGTIVRI